MNVYMRTSCAVSYGTNVKNHISSAVPCGTNAKLHTSCSPGVLEHEMHTSHHARRAGAVKNASTLLTKAARAGKTRIRSPPQARQSTQKHIHLAHSPVVPEHVKMVTACSPRGARARKYAYPTHPHKSKRKAFEKQRRNENILLRRGAGAVENATSCSPGTLEQPQILTSCSPGAP